MSTGLIFFLRPVAFFCFILGVNLMLSSAKHEYGSLWSFVRSGYFGRRLLRLFFPVLITVLVALVLNILLDAPTIRRTLAQYIAGWPPIAAGPGDYFIPIYWQFIWIAPILWLLCKRLHPIAFFLLCSVVDVAFQLVMTKTSWGVGHDWLLGSCVLRYLSVIAAGQILAGQLSLGGSMAAPSWKRHWMVCLYGVFGALMFYLQMYSGFVPFEKVWNGQNLLTGGLFVAMAYGVILARSRARSRIVCLLSRPVEVVGEASFHILLVQMLYFYRGTGAAVLFSTSENHSLPLVVGALVATLSAGLLFWYAEKLLWRLFIKIRPEMSRFQSAA